MPDQSAYTNTVFKSESDFVDTMRSLYSQELAKRGISTEFTDYLVAQDGLESGWGTSNLSKRNNFGGITNGGLQNGFQNFKSPRDYVEYKVKLLSSKRYAGVFDSPNTFIDRVIQGGYTPDHGYKQRVLGCLNRIRRREGTYSPQIEAGTSTTSTYSPQQSFDISNILAAVLGYTPTTSYQTQSVSTSVPNPNFNLEKALQKLRRSAHYESTSQCATYVRQALEEGFGKALSGHPRLAKDYKKYLPTIGYQELDYDPKMQAQAGDVIVYENPKSKAAAGHIAMFDGKQWISDFKQRSPLVYKNVKNAKVYRLGTTATTTQITTTSAAQAIMDLQEYINKAFTV